MNDIVLECCEKINLKKQLGNMSHTDKLMWFFTSYLGINPSVGCYLDCGYCILDKDVANPSKVRKKDTAKYTLDRILKDNRVKKKNPMTFFNLSDPFLKQNINDLMYILEGMDDAGQENPVVLITKLNPDRVNPKARVLDRISQLENLKPVLMVTYANVPKKVEPASSSARIELMAKAKMLGIPVVQYARPLWEEWTPMDKIEEMAEQTANIVDSVVIGGILTTEGIKQKLARRLEGSGIPVPQWGNDAGRHIAKDYRQKVIDAYHSKNPNLGVFVNSSCGISNALGIHNYMGYYWHFANKQDGTCNMPCQSEQRELCAYATPLIRKQEDVENFEAERKKVKNILDQFNASRAAFNICDGYLELFVRFGGQEVRQIRQDTGMFVYWPGNLKMFGHRTKQG